MTISSHLHGMDISPPPGAPGSFDRPPDSTATAGVLRLELWYEGREPEPRPDHGARQRYSYRVTDVAPPTVNPDDDGPAVTTESVAVGSDLRSGVGGRVDPDEMMRTLVAFLSAAGEAYASSMRNPSAASENLALFPAWLNEAAYSNLSELAVLELDLNPDLGLDDVEPEAAFLAATETPGPARPWPPATWYDVVFLQDEEGHQVVDLIDEQGVEAAIEHLSGWDFGTETRDTAVLHEHVHDRPPGGMGGHLVVEGVYALSWHAGLGHVNLLRRFDPADEPPAFWPDPVSRLAPEAAKDGATTTPAHRPSHRPEAPSL